MPRLLHAVAVVTALVLPAIARADIYKFTDADGTIHFTNTPGRRQALPPLHPRQRRQKSGQAAPGVVPVPPSDHDVARFTRYDDVDPSRRPRSTRSPSSSFAPSSGARATTTRAPSAFRARAASCSSCPTRRCSCRCATSTTRARTSSAECAFLRVLANEFNGDLELTVAAYNAGDGAVIRSGGIPAIRPDARLRRERHQVLPPLPGHHRPRRGQLRWLSGSAGPVPASGRARGRRVGRRVACPPPSACKVGASLRGAALLGK